MSTLSSKPTTTSNLPPNQSLYISNLNDKLRKDDLRLSLYTLFSTYGVVLDVVALKTKKMRGQAHVAFRDIGTATLAMRGCQGMRFFGKEMVGLAISFHLLSSFPCFLVAPIFNSTLFCFQCSQRASLLQNYFCIHPLTSLLFLR